MGSTRKFDKVLILLLLALALLVVAVTAAPVSSQTYIVHMAENASHTDVMAKGVWYNEIMQGAKMVLLEGEEDDGKDCLHHVFDKVLNGFSARLTPAQVAYVEKLPGVLKLYPSRIHTMSTTHSPEFLGLTATGAALWNKSNYGDGVVIGVIDTGIWPERPSFSDHELGSVPVKWKGVCETGVGFNATHCNRKIIGARYFLKGNEAMFGPINSSNEFRSPRDYNGHGTHCASIAAGRESHPASAYGLAGGTAMGMAPKARIAVYKALWRDEGRGTTDDIVAAIDQAILDGVDVISFSIAGFDQAAFQSDPIAIAAYNAAVNHGIFFSAAAGNSGPSARTVESIAPWITTVAAVTQDREINAPVELGDGRKLSGRSSFNGTSGVVNGSNVILPLVYAGYAAIHWTLAWNASVCQTANYLEIAKVRGKLVLCDYDSTTDYYNILLGTGAAGIILANTLATGEALELLPPFPAPFTQVSNSVRVAIMNYIRGTALPVARILPATTLIPGLKPAPQVARFSSRGPPAAKLVGGYQWLKPDIAAPGVDILAAGIGNEYYTFMSGTSMACPHVSGIAALLKSVHPTWSPAAIRSAMMTTARSLDNANHTIGTAEETDTLSASGPWAFGAGLIQPEKAMNPGLVYDMGHDNYFYFLCSVLFLTEQFYPFGFTNFTCPNRLRVEDMNLPSIVALFNSQGLGSEFSFVTFGRVLTSVSTSGDVTSNYTATIEHPQGFRISIEPPILSFSPTVPSVSFTVTVSANGTTEMPRFGSSGSITWSDGLHVVRTPVVAANVDLWT